MQGGIVTLMGSGELTGTMVEVHKALVQRHSPGTKAVFLDTPAGFQLNVDHLAAKAITYFERNVQNPLTVASLKSQKETDVVARAKAHQLLRQADYILIGPGSPTYALAQWKGSPVPDLFQRHLEKGGCLVAASAAALTLGSWTLPVYEIYKVGQNAHWVAGLNLLGHFGLDWAVIPHWNNTEGGNHDTRYCFMGHARLQELLDQLPESVWVVGLDEHTALEIDLVRRNAQVKGLGKVTLIRRSGEKVFGKGDQIALDHSYGSRFSAPAKSVELSATTPNTESDPLWESVRGLETRIRRHLDQCRLDEAVRLLLSFEGWIWQNHEQLAEKEALGAVREVFRDVLAALGFCPSPSACDREKIMTPLVKSILALRAQCRSKGLWAQADALRDSLMAADIIVTDGRDGVHWRPVKKHGSLGANPERTDALDKDETR